MADLIDRAQTIKLLMGEAVGKYPQSFYFGLFAATKELKELPAVDAVEVVRCKDCKHRHIDKDFASGKYCSKRWANGGRFCEDDDFCSYGRRTDG